MLNDATKRQVAAANPLVSTWLAANAGSGKTRVLTDRVARLLLQKVSPQNILCLTYTKAAASEMQNRLFERLGKWAMMDDAGLVKELRDLGVSNLDDAKDLSFARTLFARAIDTPGGLRIQTIHSFCASLLRRFPLEAGVSPVFREMEERAAKLLRQDVVDNLARGEHAGIIHGLAKHYSGEDFGNLAAEAIRHRAAAITPKTDAEIWQQFGLPVGLTVNQLLANTFLGGEAKLFSAWQPILQQSEKSTDQKAAAIFSQIKFDDPTIPDLVQLFSPLLFGAKAKEPFSAKLSSFPTKDLRLENPEITARLGEFMVRIEQARADYARLIAAQKTRAFLNFASVFLPIYETRKAQSGWLDFDDLITRARSLLSDPAVAQWVLFRLDGGLDHILVDEAQDTSPDQWKVVELLAQEFSAGAGARADIQRTIFVVGDLKQSIYSFQGADPKAFEQMRQHFSRDLQASRQTLFAQSLEHSFRSSPAILTVVDAVFEGIAGSGFDGTTKHLAFHKDLPGRVDLWAIADEPAAELRKDWYDPSDTIASNDHRIVLAETIANQINILEKTGSIPDGNGGFRSIEFGDFLILVQSRSPLFHQIIRACKSLDLPIAGADRLKIGSEIAVNDLQALLEFLALPQDSLSLAAALRSPLFGFSEAQLYRVAHDRPEKDLWPALLRHEREFQAAVDMLKDLRNQVDFLRPYDLLERVLTRHSGRNNLLARLGCEAEDGIDALLNQAAAYEGLRTPSLTGFLTWLEADGIEIKRQSDNAGGRIRVMTTHGAKGLESPIVILPDSADRNARQQDEIIKSTDGSLMWNTQSDLRPSIISDAIEQAKVAAEQEAARLLYVALTRAENWLIVCASGTVKEAGNSWYRKIKAGMKGVGALPLDGPTGSGIRVEHGAWQAVNQTTQGSKSVWKPVLPDWATRRSAIMKTTTGPISPSKMPGDKALANELSAQSANDGIAWGNRIHLLLEHLPGSPSSCWSKVAKHLLGGGPDAVSNEVLAALVAQAGKVITCPAFSDVFGPDSIAEVVAVAPIPDLSGQRMRGTIDRLVVLPTQVLIVDFKSNQVVPKVASVTPTGILRQMAVYLAAVEQIYPDREIELAIGWTHDATLMPLPHDIVRASLQSLPHLDVLDGRP